MDQSQRHKYVSRFEPLALHPRLHYREGFLIHYLPPREPPTRRICYNTKSTKLLSQTTTSQPRGKPTTNTSTEEVYNHQLHLTQEGVNNNLHLYQRGSKPITSNPQPQPLPKREQPNNEGLGGVFQPQTISPFHKQKILNRLG